ncbi:MAG: hypothetical protein WC538_19665 [Thermoanaerobaculia bacterium]|jgi:hypothetical protein
MKRRILFTLAIALAMAATPGGAQVLRLSTENDILSRSGPADDLYTFGIAFEVESAGSGWSLRENAFTDRAAGIRFDETYLSVRRPLPVDGPWNLSGELGLVHVGEGLFGQNVQNAVHRAVGSDQVELEYPGSSTYTRMAITATRPVDSNGSFTWGPSFDADVVPGFRSWLLVTVDAVWQPRGRFAVELQPGARFTSVSYDALEPHVASSALAGRASVVFDDRIFVTWSYNDYGDEREHVSIGYRVPLGGRTRELHDGR